MITVLSLSLLNCSTSEGTSASASGSDNSTDTGSVSGTSGTLTSADGASIAGASVTLSQSSSVQSLTTGNITNDNGQYKPLYQTTDADGETCDDITDAVSGTIIASDCTSSDGSYSLTAAEVPCGSTLTLTAKKGSFFMSLEVTLSCTDTDGDGETTDEVVAMDTLVFDDDCGTTSETDSSFATTGSPKYTVDSTSCNFDIANMAVVTGHYDEIENVLAKLGFGAVDDHGSLDKAQPYDFTLVDGNNSLDDAEYDNFEDFVSDLDTLNQYDIIFINCGNAQELLATNPAIIANLQAYVENGGKLYVTDWSYGFLEQSFSDFMNFLDGGDDHDHAEDHAAAKQGSGGITVDATISDQVLSAWLEGVTVNDGSIADDCSFIEDAAINAQVGALNADGTMTIGDFLGSWVVMEGEHDGLEGDSNIWLSGDIVNGGDDIVDAPLTATQDRGDGRILYSSYHTAHSCPTTGFWPQERVLQYLVFEL